MLPDGLLSPPVPAWPMSARKHGAKEISYPRTADPDPSWLSTPHTEMVVEEDLKFKALFILGEEKKKNQKWIE